MEQVEKVLGQVDGHIAEIQAQRERAKQLDRLLVELKERVASRGVGILTPSSGSCMLSGADGEVEFFSPHIGKAFSLNDVRSLDDLEYLSPKRGRLEAFLEDILAKGETGFEVLG